MKTLRRSLPYALIVLACALVYAPVLGKIAVNPDAMFMLKVLTPIQSATEYLRLLFSFGTIDWQPVRDLSFFFDLWIFHHTGIVSFATLNVLLWIGTCFCFYRLVRRNLFWTLLFAVYPFFTQAVPWGMNRKHVLGVFLLLVATNFFLQYPEKKSSAWKSLFFSACASLSHPLMIFWPVWAVFHLWYVKNVDLKKHFPFMIGSSIATLLLLFVNFRYHTSPHEVMREYFPANTGPSLHPLDMVVTFLFGLKQIAFPFRLGFLYHPNFLKALPGLAIFAGIVLLLRKTPGRRDVKSWLFFCAIPLPIVLPFPHIYYDHYFFIPAIGLFLTLATLVDLKTLQERAGVAVCILVAAAFSYSQVKIWLSPLAFAERNFDSAPSCKSATQYLAMKYAVNSRAPVEPLKFFLENHCFLSGPSDPPAAKLKATLVHAEILYYEDFLPMDVRLSTLETLGKIHAYPLLLKAGLLAQLKQSSKVQAITDKLLPSFQGKKLEMQANLRKTLAEFCEQSRIPSCLRLLELPRGEALFPELLLESQPPWSGT